MGHPKRGKKKLCIVTPEFPPDNWGGLARTAVRVAHHALDMGLRVHVVHLAVEDDPLVLLDENRETRTVDGLIVHRLTVGREGTCEPVRGLWECPHNLTLLMMYQSLEMLFREEQFDLFHSFFLYPVGFVTGLLARRVRRPSIVTLVGNDVKKYVFSPEKVGVCRSGLDNADMVVALSWDLMETAHALSPVSHKARIIYNSVEIPSQAWQTERDAKSPFRIGCGGIFKYAKGLPYLFKAMASLGKDRNVTLELCGTVRESEKGTYDAMVRKTGITHRLTLKDPLPHEAMPEWLRSLDVFVLPSVSEGCPNILMEAMACGLPCVATRTGAVEELIEDRVSGLLVPWGDSRALAGALAEIVDKPDLAWPLGYAARLKMTEFSGQRERRAWEQVYREVLGI
jgi:L-malate glycosyltransferase